MENRLSNQQFRKQARFLLRGNWIKMACIIFLFFLIKMSLMMVVTTIFENTQKRIPAESLVFYVLYNFVLYPLGYGPYYCALTISKKRVIKISMVLEIFKGKLYFPMMLISFTSCVISSITEKIIYYTTDLFLGRSLCDDLFNNEFSLEMLNSLLSKKPFLVSCFLMSVIVYFLIMVIIAVKTEITILVKLNNPRLTLIEAFRYACDLTKDKNCQYIILDLSIYGWYLLVSSLAAWYFPGSHLGTVALLWVLPYCEVAKVCFYNAMCKEKAS